MRVIVELGFRDNTYIQNMKYIFHGKDDPHSWPQAAFWVIEDTGRDAGKIRTDGKYGCGDKGSADQVRKKDKVEKSFPKEYFK